MGASRLMRIFSSHPLKRVEAEMQMEGILYERFGRYGLGEDRNKMMPVVGPVHNAAGYLISEMLGCKVEYLEDSAPQVIAAGMESLEVKPNEAFKSPIFKKFIDLREKLKVKFGYVTGDINWGGVLNIALDLAGEQVLIDFYTNPELVQNEFKKIAGTIETLITGFVFNDTGSTSISVNRNIRHIKEPVFLHSECSHTMISTEQYEEFLLPIDLEWSKRNRPFGIHYCGPDPHRFAETFSKIENLDFLDVGWGGDVKMLREHLPDTFLNIRLDPVTIGDCTDREIEATITRLAGESGNPYLTGICCINMDDKVEDSKINTIFETVEHLRQEYLGLC